MTTTVTQDMTVATGTVLTYTVTPPENNPLYFTYATLGVVGSKVGSSQIVVYVQGVGVPTFTGSGSTIQGTAPSGLAQFSTIVLNHTGNANEWSYA